MAACSGPATTKTDAPQPVNPELASGCSDGKLIPCTCAVGKGYQRCTKGTFGDCVCRLSERRARATRTVRPPKADDLRGYLLDMGRDGQLWTKIDTSHGAIRCRLHRDRAPLAVTNFVGLARGLKAWTDPRSNTTSMKKLYDDSIFHRVVPNFMIQGGDPLRNGRGGPGYKFANETHPNLKFDRAGVLAMANAGPGTNGSQFFITVRATAWLNGRHTIFGQCDDLPVVWKIARLKRDSKNAPKTPVFINSVTFLLGRRPN